MSNQLYNIARYMIWHSSISSDFLRRRYIRGCDQCNKDAYNPDIHEEVHCQTCVYDAEKGCKVNVEFIPSLSENKPVAAIMFPQDSKITNTNGIENWNVWNSWNPRHPKKNISERTANYWGFKSSKNPPH